ncbi:MAG: hypothetical protein J2P17_26035 [Mycobacterium sp.]|nr:hypothetical protein [Mycobacterium sp.]
MLIFNLKDFAVDSTSIVYPEVVHPDLFLWDLLDLAPRRVVDVLHRKVARHKSPPRHLLGLLEALERSGTPKFAAEVRRRLG